MEQAYKYTDVFLTHTWRPDLNGRNNHDRVRIVNRQLNRLGFSSWFDENKMEGEIEAKMAEGVDFTRCVVVFVTEQYMMKINAKHHDNCKYEFDRALAQKTEKKMLCIVMEERYNDPANWFGKLKEALGNCLFVSMAGDLSDDVYLKQQLNLVVDQLKSKGVLPSQMKKKCNDCTLMGRNGERHALFIDGDYCTHCASALQKTKEAKNFCTRCNSHENGYYCSNCKTHLLDKETKIKEISEQCINELALDPALDLSSFVTTEIEQTIDQFMQEIQELNAKRKEAQNKNKDLQLSDESYSSKMKVLEANLAALMENAKSMTTSAEKCSKLLKPAYDDELKVLRQTMQSLSEKRREINRCNDVASRTVEELQRIRKQVLDIKEVTMQGEDPLEHGKSCSCDECVFERHFTSQMMIYGTKYLRDLVKENKIAELKQAIGLKKEILDMEDDYGCNVLTTCAITHGSLDMLKMLQEYF